MLKRFNPVSQTNDAFVFDSNKGYQILITKENVGKNRRSYEYQYNAYKVSNNNVSELLDSTAIFEGPTNIKRLSTFLSKIVKDRQTSKSVGIIWRDHVNRKYIKNIIREEFEKILDEADNDDYKPRKTKWKVRGGMGAKNPDGEIRYFRFDDMGLNNQFADAWKSGKIGDDALDKMKNKGKKKKPGQVRKTKGGNYVAVNPNGDERTFSDKEEWLNKKLASAWASGKLTKDMIKKLTKS